MNKKERKLEAVKRLEELERQSSAENGVGADRSTADIPENKSENGNKSGFANMMKKVGVFGKDKDSKKAKEKENKKKKKSGPTVLSEEEWDASFGSGSIVDSVNPLYEANFEHTRNPLFDGAEDSSGDDFAEKEWGEQELAKVRVTPGKSKKR